MEQIFGICLHRLGSGFDSILQQDKRRLPAKIWGLRQLTQKWAIDLRQVALQTSLDNDNMADRLFNKHLHDFSRNGFGNLFKREKTAASSIKGNKVGHLFHRYMLGICLHILGNGLDKKKRLLSA